MKEKDIQEMTVLMYELLKSNNEKIMQDMIMLLNAMLRCIPHDGKIVFRTAEEDAEISKRHTKPHFTLLGERIDHE